MAPTYRADSLAQVIDEGVRMFGPEVTAAALLAAVEATPVRLTTQRATKSTARGFGYFCPSRSFRRKLWTTFAVIALAAFAGAVVFGGGWGSRDDAASLIATVNAASSSAAPASDKPFRRHLSLRRRPNPNGDAEAAAAPAVPEADTAPPPKSQHATDASTTTPATAEPNGQPTSTLKERRRASPERASRDDRLSDPRRVGFTDAHAAQTTKSKKATTVAQTQNAPVPAKDPNCNVFLPDNVFMSHHDQFRCFR
jgi:hypothetical protein